MEDILAVTKNEKGKIQLHQAVKLTAAGAVGGSFWGMLICMIRVKSTSDFSGYRKKANLDPNYSQFLQLFSVFFLHHVKSSVTVARDRGLKILRSSTNKVTISAGQNNTDDILCPLLTFLKQKKALTKIL